MSSWLTIYIRSLCNLTLWLDFLPQLLGFLADFTCGHVPHKSLLSLHMMVADVANDIWHFAVVVIVTRKIETSTIDRLLLNN